MVECSLADADCVDYEGGAVIMETSDAFDAGDEWA